MALISNVTAGNPVSASWGNAIRDASVMQCLASERASITAVEGQLVYITDEDRFYVYSGSAWSPVGLAASATGRTGGRWSIASGAPQSFTTGTGAFLSWTTEAADSDGFLTPTASTITVPANLGGQYLVSASIIWSGDPTGNVTGGGASNNASLSIVWNIGGVDYTTNAEVSKGSVYTNRIGVTGFAIMSAADSFQVRARQVSGGTLTAYGFLHLARIGV